jgi:hypothetical protein
LLPFLFAIESFSSAAKAQLLQKYAAFRSVRTVTVSIAGAIVIESIRELANIPARMEQGGFSFFHHLESINWYRSFGLDPEPCVQ